jgi:hypothetical protein
MNYETSELSRSSIHINISLSSSPRIPLSYKIVYTSPSIRQTTAGKLDKRKELQEKRQ